MSKKATKSKTRRPSKATQLDALDPMRDELRSIAQYNKAVELLGGWQKRPENLAGLFTDRQTKDLSSVAWQVAHEVGTATDSELSMKVLLNAVRKSPLIPVDARAHIETMIQRVVYQFFRSYIEAAMLSGLALGQQLKSDGGAR
jgi:hypothetical protein